QRLQPVAPRPIYADMAREEIASGAAMAAIRTSDERESDRILRVRANVLRDRRLRLAAAVGALWIIGFSIATAIVGGTPTGRKVLDASIMVVAVGMAGWIWLISPQLAWGASLATATGIAYPLLGVAILMMLGTLAFGSHRQVPLSIVLVAVGFAVSALTDAG